MLGPPGACSRKLLHLSIYVVPARARCRCKQPILLAFPFDFLHQTFLTYVSTAMDFRSFVREQFTRLPYPSTKHTGQTIIVTGANVGLGLEAARHFTRLDAEKVILGVRNVEKGEAAKKSIEETTNRKGVVEVWQLDLSSYESVKQFAKKAEGLKRLDAIVENAGIATHTFRVSEDNESTITTVFIY